MSLDLVVRLLGRRRAWRLGRRLYMAARGEVPNDIATNGEAALIGQCIRAFRTSDSKESERFVAFDIGANLGLWSKVVLRESEAAGVTCAVEVFEPVAGAFDRLVSEFGQMENVRLHQCAVSDRNGTAQMQIVGEFAGTNSLSPSIDPSAISVEVPVETLSDIRSRLGIGTIHLCKIDAEGHDLAILEGMRDALRAGALEVVQFEYNWRWLMNGSTLQAVFALARDVGYRVGRVAPDHLEMYSEWSFEHDRFFENNYVLVRADVLPRLVSRETRWDDSNVLVV
jgi:FkbM family methyltransferase